jgi:hypothetical protein
MIERRRKNNKRRQKRREQNIICTAKKNDNGMTIFTHEQNENSVIIDWMDILRATCLTKININIFKDKGMSIRFS